MLCTRPFLPDPHPEPAHRPGRGMAGAATAKRWLQTARGLAATALLGLASTAWAQCGTLPVTYPITAGSSALNMGGTNVVNGTTVTGTTGASITIAGVRTSAIPASFPSLPTPVSAITVNNLNIANGTTYTFTPGDYIINNATIGSTVTIVTQAGARLFLQGNISAGTSLVINSAGPTEMGLFYLRPNANLTVGSSSSIRGIIYSPGTGNNVSIGSGSMLTGAIVVNGGITLGGLTVTLSSADQTELSAVSTCADTTKPTLVSATQVCGNPKKATLVFSEELRKTQAQTTSNFSIPLSSITSAVLESDYKTVTLTTSAAMASSTVVSVSNLADLVGNVITAGSSAALSAPTMYSGIYGSYFGQNGNIGPTYAFSGTQANRVDSMVYFSWTTGAPGVGSTPADGFSVRWTGVIKATTTGTYAFATNSDDGVRLYIDGTKVIDNWTLHSPTVDATASRISLTAGSYYPVTMEFFENGGDATAMLAWQEPAVTGTTYYIVPASQLYNCTASANALTGFTITPAATTASTCSTQTLTVKALDTDGTSAYTSYTGTVTLNTGTGRGTWAKGSGPVPGGTLVNNGDGTATYTFVAGDAGVARFTLAHSLAQNVTATVNDGTYNASATPIQYRDNAFVFAEDLSNRVSGSDVAVAGRPHDMTLSLLKKDPSTGSCGVATDYSGSRALKFWRTDAGGTHTAPTVVSPALTIPAAQPAANNLTLTFTNGVASFNLGTSDQGRYALNVLDDSLTAAATSVSGASNTLTVRPFVVMIQAIKYGSTLNPNGSAATDGVLGPAGANFGATVAAYTWNSAMLTNGADTNNTGTPLATATETAMKAGNRVNSFASAVVLSPVAASQTPAGGTMGSLNNGTIAGSSFASGAATVSNLQYTEVGSFALNTTGVVSNFLGSGLSLDAVVTNSAGVQNTRVGRFVPAGFTVSNASLVHRSSASCSPASSFSYLGEPFQLGFTLTAVNALGATTTNYTGSYAKLSPASAATWNLAGIDGGTMFSTTTSPARLTLGSSSGSWANGVASNITLLATAQRGTSVDGPFSANFGIAPVDSDGVTMQTFDLDTTSPANGNDHTLLSAVVLRHGRLRLANAIGAQQRPLGMDLRAQYWNGSAWADNTLDSCTRVPATAVNFGNLRKSLTATDTTVSGSTVSLTAGAGKLVLAAPGGGRSGTVDVALSLGATATDNSCLQTWTPAAGDAATAGAGLPWLRGAWCGSSLDKDPSARASFGLFKGNDNLIYQRENY
ncbi:DUF6701 domain-containing protein [Ideonella margarita]|uniref:DUF6701 domain-containing protein n=1 Tax=Ideonella margarita TaxID=2984191 RepID=A0ABU9CBI8_9BURK